MSIRKRTLINMLKDKYEKFTAKEKQIVRNLSLDSFRNSEDIVIVSENNDVRVVNVSNILFINEPKNGIVFIRTKEELIEYRSTFDIKQYVINISSLFRYINNKLIINISQITYYDSYKRQVYFDLENRLFVNVTGIAMKNIIIKECGKENDLCLVSVNGYYEY